MKKIIFAIGIVFVLTTGCKRDYTCTCSVLFSGTTSTTSTKFNDTKSKATNDCNSLNSTTATQTVICALN